MFVNRFELNDSVILRLTSNMVISPDDTQSKDPVGTPALDRGPGVLGAVLWLSSVLFLPAAQVFQR